MDVKVSVIIPIYNIEKYLPECLESIINQTFKEIEIICVNELSDVYIDELIQCDSLIDAEGDIYTVLNSEQSYIKFNTPVGHKKYQWGTEELKSFCNLIPGLKYDDE